MGVEGDLVEADIGDPAIAGGGQHRHMMGGRVQVRAAQRHDRRGVRERLLGRAEALTDHVTEVMVNHVVLGPDNLREPVTPSVSETGVSTSRMFAPGAIVWDASTSSVVSPAQPSKSEFSVGRDRPGRWMIVNEGGAGSPYWAS